MSRDGRKAPREAEAIGQEEVHAATAELGLEIAVSVENVSNQRLGRRKVGVGRVEHGAGGTPASLPHQSKELLELFGVVLLHELVTKGAFEAQNVAGRRPHALEIVEQRPPEKVADRGLDGPSPLGVEMRCSNHIEPRLSGGLDGVLPGD